MGLPTLQGEAQRSTDADRASGRYPGESRGPALPNQTPLSPRRRGARSGGCLRRRAERAPGPPPSRGKAGADGDRASGRHSGESRGPALPNQTPLSPRRRGSRSGGCLRRRAERAPGPPPSRGKRRELGRRRPGLGSSPRRKPGSSAAEPNSAFPRAGGDPGLEDVSGGAPDWLLRPRLRGGNGESWADGDRASVVTPAKAGVQRSLTKLRFPRAGGDPGLEDVSGGAPDWLLRPRLRGGKRRGGLTATEPPLRFGSAIEGGSPPTALARGPPSPERGGISGVRVGMRRSLLLREGRDKRSSRRHTPIPPRSGGGPSEAWWVGRAVAVEARKPDGPRGAWLPCPGVPFLGFAGSAVPGGGLSGGTIRRPAA